jgi:AraC family transcriptional regulator
MHGSRETGSPPADGIDYGSAGSAQAETRADGDSPSPAGAVAIHPIVGITPAAAVKRLGTGWHWWFSESVHIPTSNTIEFRFRGSVHLLVLYNEGVRSAGETSIDSLYSSKLHNLIHKLTFVPAGRSYREWHATSAPTRVTFLYLNPIAFQKFCETSPQPRIHFEDPLVWDTASKLRNTIESGRAKCMSYLQALSGVLAHELSSADQILPQQTKPSRGGLASWQRRVVLCHIEKHLGEQVFLPELAELAELSPHHFCRAFKQSLGLPPHQYQVQRRMEVAKLLLADRTTSVTDIALTLGYSQISSFSSAFRKATGWAPTVYRRLFKGADAMNDSGAMPAPASPC